MSGNPSYRKGYRLETQVQHQLAQYGPCERTFMSGAYKGDCDLKWYHRFRFWRVDCKSRAASFLKDYRRLERSDILIDKADRKIPIVKMLLPKFLEINGLTESDIEGGM